MRKTSQPATWDQDKPAPAEEPERNPYIDIDALDDGRCKASTFRQSQRTQKPRYTNWFGPGGYNRCIGDEGHANPQHKDEWGYVFLQDHPGGPVKTLRHEEPTKIED